MFEEKTYNAKCDIWSLGCVLYELCALEAPCIATSIVGVMKKATTGNFDRIPENYSDELHQMISSMLTVNVGIHHI